MVLTRRGTRLGESDPPEGEDDQEEELDLRQQVEQLQLQLEEAEAELRVLRGLDNGNGRGKRVSLAPGDLQPTPVAQGYDTDLGKFDVHKAYKTADSWSEKFSGTGKNTTLGLTKLTSKLVSILEDYDAPNIYRDIINLEIEGVSYNSKANRHVVGLLDRLTTGKANNLVERYTLQGDGRLCWKAINSEYMPTDYLSLSNTNRDIFDFAVKAGAPDVQLDSLEKKMAAVDSVCQAPMEHHMKCAAMVAALARADSTIYGDLVTNLTARSYADIDKISLAEIRSLALSAYQTAQQRRAFQTTHSTSAIGKKLAPARPNVEKKKKPTVKVGDKDKVPTSIPLCRICKNASKVEYHWHRDCPRNSSTSSTSSMSKKAKNVTFEELEEDE